METIFYQTNIWKRENLYANHNPNQALEELISRTKFPEIYDEDVIEVYREQISDYFKSSGGYIPADYNMGKIITLKDFSVFNLNYFDNGTIPEESFIESEFLTFYIYSKEDLYSTRIQLQKNPLIHCLFKSHTDFHLIMVLRLDKPVKVFASYKSLFENYAKIFQRSYQIEVLNFEHPLATFYFSHDPEIYVNRKARRIPALKILKEIK